jgi:hypothetical protein
VLVGLVVVSQPLRDGWWWGWLGAARWLERSRRLAPQARKYHVRLPVLRDAFISRSPERIDNDDNNQILGLTEAEG